MPEVVNFTFVDNATDMAQFRDGGIKPVSVLKSTGANVVIFAFDKGTGLREHMADGPVLLQAIEGSVTVQLEGTSIPLGPGDLLHIEAEVPHSVEATERAKLQLIVLMIDSPGPSQIPEPTQRLC